MILLRLAADASVGYLVQKGILGTTQVQVRAKVGGQCGLKQQHGNVTVSLAGGQGPKICIFTRV